MRRRLALLPAGIVALLSASIAHARTWTDVQGRTLEADLVSVKSTEVTLRRADGRVFTLPLSTLSAADQNFIAAQRPPPGASESPGPAPFDFVSVNRLLGVPLLADENLWDDAPSDAAARLKLRLEGKTRLFEGYRTYPQKPIMVAGAEAHMIALQAADGRVTALAIQFANRGDFPAFAKRLDPLFPPTKAELKDFEQALKRDFESLSNALITSLGAPQRENTAGGLDAGRRSLRWESGPLAFVLNQDAEQMVSLKIVPAEKTSVARLSDDQVRRLFKERITRRPSGDVILDQIPMVDQGPKGYCVPATFERYLRYAGIPADMYELAAAGGTDFGGGTGFGDMARGLDRYVRRHGRRLEKVSLRLTAQNVARYIDEGRPLIWGLYSTDRYNQLANANTQARRNAPDLKNWNPKPASAELSALTPETDRGHACLIVGYNRSTGEIAVSDSWGPDYQERWVPASAAQRITQDEYWVLAW